MKLPIITPIFLIIQLYGSSLAADLPTLPNNRLAEGPDRDLPNATPINCGFGRPVTVTVASTKTPAQVLTSTIFGRDAITAGPIGSALSPRPGRESKFKYSEVRGSKVMYGLAVDPSGESAYWLPQGGTIDIPHTPSATQPKYVFTPDFSGCSWTVTPMSNGNLRIRHVEGGREAVQFNNLTPAQKGGPTTYAMQYKDYGYIVETRRLVSNVPAYAYMQFTGGRWTLSFQRKSCTPETGGYTFNQQRLLTGMVLNESRSTYPAISDADLRRTPSGTIDIPHTPSATQPKYVFTPDFSGCSWTVTPMGNGNLRIRHVEGGREAVQFNNLTPAQKGGPTTYAMQYKDYGYIVETRRLVSNVPAYAYMQFTGGRWTLSFQRKSCTPETGGYTFNQQRLLTGMTLNESRSTVVAISSTKTYTIP